MSSIPLHKSCVAINSSGRVILVLISMLPLSSFLLFFFFCFVGGVFKKPQRVMEHNYNIIFGAGGHLMYPGFNFFLLPLIFEVHALLSLVFS